MRTNLLWVACLVMGAMSLHAQDKTPPDSLADFEVPYLIGIGRELTVNLYRDMNGLKDNISEDVKNELFQYIYSSFKDSSRTEVKSELRYQSSLSSLLRRPPVVIEKYLSDFETSAEIASLALDKNSFQFTFPQNIAPYTFEMYGAFQQDILDISGDTLNQESIFKLALFVVTRDSLTPNMDIRIASLTLLDPVKSPNFMEPGELEVLNQQYLKFKRLGGTAQNLELMDSGVLSAIVEAGQQRRKEKEQIFLENLDGYLDARKRHDDISAAKYFISARKLKRGDPFLISEETDLNYDLNDRIKLLYSAMEDAAATLNYRDFKVMSKQLSDALDLHEGMNGYAASNEREARSLIDDFTDRSEVWESFVRKTENSTMRPNLKSDLESAVKGKSCSSGEENVEQAQFNTLLGIIAAKEASTAENNNASTNLLNKAITCKEDFAIPKLELINLSLTNSLASQLEYYENLSYYEPKNPFFHLEVGLINEKLGKIEKAIENFSQTIRYDPNNTEALDHLSSIFMRLERWEESIKYLEILTDISADKKYSILLAYSYMEAEGYGSDRAQNLAAKLQYSKLDPANRVLTDSILTIYQDSTIYNNSITKRNDKSVSFYEKMLVLGGSKRENYREWAHGAECYLNLGNHLDYYERSNVFADSAISHSSGKSYKAFLTKGKVNRELGHFQAAKEAHFSLLDLDNTQEANFETGETYFQEGREYTVARIYFERSLAKLPKKATTSQNYQNYLRIGQSHRGEGMYKESIKALKSASKEFKDRGEPLFEMGLTYRASGESSDLKKSVKVFEKAREKNFEGYKSFSNMLSSLFGLEDYKGIKELYADSGYQYDKELEEHDWSHLLLAQFFTDELDKATDVINKASSISDNFRTKNVYLNMQGFIYLKKAVTVSMSQTERQNFIQMAEDEFELALDNRITDGQAFLGRSMTRFYKKNNSSYLDDMESALTFDVEYMNFQNDKAFSDFFRDKQVKDIIKKFEK